MKMTAPTRIEEQPLLEEHTARENGKKEKPRKEEVKTTKKAVIQKPVEPAASAPEPKKTPQVPDEDWNVVVDKNRK